MVREKHYRVLEALVDKKDTVFQIWKNIRALKDNDPPATSSDQQQLLAAF
jgi:hypothetical protein